MQARWNAEYRARIRVVAIRLRIITRIDGDVMEGEMGPGRAIVLTALVACGGADRGDSPAATVEVDTSSEETTPPPPDTLELSCSGTAAYYHYVEVDVTPGELPPRIVIWSRVNPAWAEWYEGLSGQNYEAEWYVNEGGTFDDQGRLLVLCNCSAATDYTFGGCSIAEAIVLID